MRIMDQLTGNGWDNCASPRREEVDSTHDCSRKDASFDMFAFSPDEVVSPRQTPKLRRSLLQKNQDIIDLYRNSQDLSESMLSERRNSSVSLSREHLFAQEREARMIAEQQLDDCRKELRSAQAKLCSQQEMLKKELSDAEMKFSMQEEKIEGLLKQHEEAERQLDECMDQVRRLKEGGLTEMDGSGAKGEQNTQNQTWNHAAICKPKSNDRNW